MSKVQNKIREYLKKKKIFFFKTIMTSKTGVQDIIACLKSGRFASFECKESWDIMSAMQEHKRDKVIQSGGISIEARHVDDVRRVIEQEEEMVMFREYLNNKNYVFFGNYDEVIILKRGFESLILCFDTKRKIEHFKNEGYAVEVCNGAAEAVQVTKKYFGVE